MCKDGWLHNDKKKGIESIAETPKEEELKSKYGIDLMGYQLMEIKKEEDTKVR